MKRGLLSAVMITQLSILSGTAQPVTAERTAQLKKESEERERQSNAKEREFVRKLHDVIVLNSREANEAAMKKYANQVQVTERSRTWRPSTATNDFDYVMVPIKGGQFMMGSPATEKGRREDEGPQHPVKVSPFWMQECEVTWEQYEPFEYNVEQEKASEPVLHETADAVAKPTKPYDEYSFGMGKNQYPALAMTQHAANKYCEWLSAKAGHFYRLPTEAEWEYACRAGSTNAYSFGDDQKDLPTYAWFEENSENKYGKTRRKKPNAWGLYDMHGNVAEWCLDEYDSTFYLRGKDTVVVDPWNKATKPYPHVIRGGAWGDDLGKAAQLRCAARAQSKREWKTDPQLPPSIWYLDACKWVGFRVVRPLKVPSAEEMFDYWNSGVERDR